MGVGVVRAHDSVAIGPATDSSDASGSSTVDAAQRYSDVHDIVASSYVTSMFATEVEYCTSDEEDDATRQRRDELRRSAIALAPAVAAVETAVAR